MVVQAAKLATTSAEKPNRLSEGAVMVIFFQVAGLDKTFVQGKNYLL